MTNQKRQLTRCNTIYIIKKMSSLHFLSSIFIWGQMKACLLLSFNVIQMELMQLSAVRTVPSVNVWLGTPPSVPSPLISGGASLSPWKYCTVSSLAKLSHKFSTQFCSISLVNNQRRCPPSFIWGTTTQFNARPKFTTLHAVSYHFVNWPYWPYAFAACTTPTTKWYNSTGGSLSITRIDAMPSLISGIQLFFGGSLSYSATVISFGEFIGS